MHAAANKPPTVSSVLTVGYNQQHREKGGHKTQVERKLCGWRKKPALMIFKMLLLFMAASMPGGQLIGHSVQDSDGFV